jgi:vancomycin permeability regulator SanA
MKVVAKVLATFAVVGFVIAVWLVIDGLSAKPGTADVAIVFGNTVERNGRPSARLGARLETARALYASGRVGRIIVTGGIGKEGFDESVVMQRSLESAGVPPTAIHADGLGLNTTRSCVNARAYMTSHGLKSADVVTQYFHVTRARLGCRRAGIRVVGAVAPRYFELRDLYSLAREVVALPVYALGVR